MSYQMVIALGNLTEDPALKYMPDGRAVCNFGLATNKEWKDKDTGEKRKKATYFRVSVFGPQAEACNAYLTKGAGALVVGEIAAHAYLPKDGGDPKASLDLTASTVRFTGGGGDREGAAARSARNEEDDDFPF